MKRIIPLFLSLALCATAACTNDPRDEVPGGSNTRLGRIIDATPTQLRTALGTGSVTVTLSLTEQ